MLRVAQVCCQVLSFDFVCIPCHLPQQISVNRCYMLMERTSNSFLVTFRSTVAVESLLNLGLPFELTV